MIRVGATQQSPADHISGPPARAPYIRIRLGTRVLRMLYRGATVAVSGVI